MRPITLKSAEFRRERQDGWQELDRLVARVEKRGVDSLTAEESLRLPTLYRATLSSLSVARAISLDRALVRYLESLSARAFYCVYGNRTGLIAAAGDFFRRRWPQAVRDTAWLTLLSAAVLFLGALTGFLLVQSSPDWFYGFMSADMAGGRTPEASTEYLRGTLFDEDRASWSDELQAFATYLFTHNSQVAILCFALGICLGLPTLALLFYNGCSLGAFVALFDSRGLGVEVIGWLSIHGATELFAIILAGAGGLKLGGAVAFPGRHGRLAELAVAGRTAGLVVVGVVVMLLAAGLLEGIGRQMIQETGLRYGIGWTIFALWIAYFVRAGRRRSEARDG